MKFYLSLFSLLLALNSNAQNGWVKENSVTFSIKHPKTWTKRPSEISGELNLAGPTPDFEGSSEHLGTTLFISSQQAKYTTIDSAVVAYKENLLSTEFLKNTTIQKEEKIEFNGVDAVEIIFSAKVQQFSTACRIILFQKDEIYYELSVSYDEELNKKLLKEAYKAMETFEFIDNK